MDNHRGNKRKVQIGAHTTENSRQRSGTHSPFLYLTVRVSKSGHRPGQDSALPVGGAAARNHRHSMPKQNSCAQTLPDQTEGVFAEQLLGLCPVAPVCCKCSASAPSPDKRVQFLTTTPLAGRAGNFSGQSVSHPAILVLFNPTVTTPTELYCNLIISLLKKKY